MALHYLHVLVVPYKVDGKGTASRCPPLMTNVNNIILLDQAMFVPYLVYPVVVVSAVKG